MERTLAPLVDGFSTVIESRDPKLLGFLVGEHVASLIDELRRVRPKVDDQLLESVADQIRPALAEDPLVLWIPEWGLCEQALKKLSAPLANRALAQISLALPIQVEPSPWTARFDAPVRLRCAALLLPPSAHMTLTATSRTPGRLIEAHDAGWTMEWPSDDLASRDIPAGAEAIRSLTTTPFQPHILSGPQTAALAWPSPVRDGVETIVETHMIHLEAGAQALERVLRHAADWWRMAVRFVSVAEAAPASIHSGSVNGFSTLISLSDCPDALKVAETFVHEGSHQYFYLLNKVDPFCTPAAAPTYSPFVRTVRPLDRVLMAYHAFVNVEHFYKVHHAQSGGEAPPILRQLDRELSSIEAPLSAPDQLTEIGRTLFERLADLRRVHATAH